MKGIEHHHTPIVRKAQRGSQKAYKQLFDLYADSMFSVANRIIRDSDDAADVTQESFIKAFRKLNQFNFNSTFGAWLKRIVINVALGRLRLQKLEFEDIEQHDVIYNADEKDWDNIDLNVQRIKDAIVTLPDGFRVICSLYLFEGLEHKEIAQILDIAESTSKSQLKRGKEKIRKLLQHESV